MQKWKKADPSNFEFRTNNKRNSSDELYQSQNDDAFVDGSPGLERDQTCWEAFVKLITFQKREDKYTSASSAMFERYDVRRL